MFRLDKVSKRGFLGGCLILVGGGPLPGGIRSSFASGACVTFTKKGVTVFLENTCAERKQALVRNYKGGELIQERVFHLTAREKRNVKHPGDFGRVEAESDWVSGQNGSRYARLSSRKERSGGVTWYIRNAHPSQYIAYEYEAVAGGNVVAIQYGTLEPGRTEPLFWFSPFEEDGQMREKFAYLDPL